MEQLSSGDGCPMEAASVRSNQLGRSVDLRERKQFPIVRWHARLSAPQHSQPRSAVNAIGHDFAF